MCDGGGGPDRRAGFEGREGIAVDRLEPVLVREQGLNVCLNVIESEGLILGSGTIRRPGDSFGNPGKESKAWTKLV